MARDGKSPGGGIVFLHWLHLVCRDGDKKARAHFKWRLQGMTKATRRASVATSVAKGWTRKVQDCCSTGGVWGGESVTTKQVRLMPALRQFSAARTPSLRARGRGREEQKCQQQVRISSGNLRKPGGSWPYKLIGTDHLPHWVLGDLVSFTRLNLSFWEVVEVQEVPDVWKQANVGLQERCNRPVSLTSVLGKSWSEPCWSTGLGRWRRRWSKPASVDLPRITRLPVMMKWQDLWMEGEQ